MDAESYTPDLGTLDGCAEEFAAALYSDSQIPARRSQQKLRAALEKDVAGGQPLPTKEEIEQLVMGDDEGQIPKALVKRFKNVDKVLKSFF